MGYGIKHVETPYYDVSIFSESTNYAAAAKVLRRVALFQSQTYKAAILTTLHFAFLIIENEYNVQPSRQNPHNHYK